jgi:hypothetical protein
MIGKQILKYAPNCFILVIPIFLWNILFPASLPRENSMNHCFFPAPTDAADD